MAQTTLTGKAGTCRGGFGAVANRGAPKARLSTGLPRAPVPAHLICPCYRPKH